jgi:molybdopterin synthase sulfur carrier subunit
MTTENGAVEVRVPSVLRATTSGQKIVRGQGDTVGDLLHDLEQRYPGIGGHLVEQDGSLRKFVNVYVNDEDIRFTGQLRTPLRGGDVVSILPAIAGG